MAQNCWFTYFQKFAESKTKVSVFRKLVASRGTSNRSNYFHESNTTDVDKKGSSWCNEMLHFILFTLLCFVRYERLNCTILSRSISKVTHFKWFINANKMQTIRKEIVYSRAKIMLRVPFVQSISFKFYFGLASARISIQNDTLTFFEPDSVEHYSVEFPVNFLSEWDSFDEFTFNWIAQSPEQKKRSDFN